MDKILCNIYDIVYKFLFGEGEDKRTAKTQLYSYVETQVKTMHLREPNQFEYFKDELKSRFNILVGDEPNPEVGINYDNVKLPPSRNSSGRKLISITLDPEVVNRLAKYCLDHDFKKSSFIERLIVDAIDK